MTSVMTAGESGWPAVILNTFTPDLYVQYFRDLQDMITAGVGEGVRGSGRDHDQGPGPDVVRGGADGEPDRAREHVEALVVLGVAVLRRAVGVRGEGDLAEAEAVRGMAAVLEDAHLRRAGQHDVAVFGTHDG